MTLFCHTSGLYYKQVHGQMSVIFMQLFWPCQMSVVYEEKISFNVHLHSQMSIKTSKCPFLRTFDCELYVYNTEMQFYGHMSVKHLFITQAPGGLYYKHIRVVIYELSARTNVRNNERKIYLEIFS